MRNLPRRAVGWMFLAMLCFVAWCYRETYFSIGQKWISDAAFSHGFLILPISLWLAWGKRKELLLVPWKTSWLGVAALGGSAMLWAVSRGTGVLVVEQFSAVALIPCLVLAVMGVQATRVLVFPLTFLVFLVPFGRALVPWLMNITADVATWALSATGVPIFRSHMYISIPSGSFEVARACSGLNYVIAGMVLGILYAYLTFTSWKKRLLCVLVFLIVPIIANGVRVYATIGISHLTDMRFGPGGEHVTFGKILFVVLIFLMFWIGQRWRDQPARGLAATVSPTSGSDLRPDDSSLAVVAGAMVAVLLGPLLFEAAGTARADQARAAGKAIILPSMQGLWAGPIPGVNGWRPLYVEALAERAGVFGHRDLGQVQVYAAVYGLGATAGAEMISYRNRLFAQERGSTVPERRRTIHFDGQRSLTVRELLITEASGDKVLVWQWFRVGDRSTTSEFTVKALEAIAFATGRTPVELVITLATAYDGLPESSDRLESFVRADLDCVMSGFAAETCRG